MKTNIYVFKKAEKNSKAIFNRERERLEKALPKYTKIEHIGSTAVHGLGGKGIIDIMICAPKGGIEKIRKKLIDCGYLQRNSPDKERMFFKREFVSAGKARRVHIHLVYSNSKNWKDALRFRDMLRDDKRLLKDYIDLKKYAFKKCKGDGEKCMKIKSEFIGKVLRDKNI